MPPPDPIFQIPDNNTANGVQGIVIGIAHLAQLMLWPRLPLLPPHKEAYEEIDTHSDTAVGARYRLASDCAIIRPQQSHVFNLNVNQRQFVDGNSDPRQP
ncbi:hypothetical protein VP1G_11029 [Cytospora mali]|uniref:Uncharacterized protein n=1 Tax=Cytospora mali TaxID=578113 RepID=A0A194V723_CYTMA|nr:hypothetical protein VP1G_11029 [Valsa mali var. pyri (nom. inval.)]